MQQYQPKGGMCSGCAYRKADCSKLPFKGMPAIGRSGSAIIVKCSEWINVKIEGEMRAHE